MARVIRPGGRIGLFDMTTSEDAVEAAYHNEVERLRDPSHASALPLSELFRLIGRAGLDADRLDTMDYELDLEDWLSRAEQSPEQAQGAQVRIAAALGTPRFGGKRVRRDAKGASSSRFRSAVSMPSSCGRRVMSAGPRRRAPPRARLRSRRWLPARRAWE